mgnify:CR=1 FL=1
MTLAVGGLLQGLSDNIVVDPRKCTFCGSCVEACVLDNLRLQLAPCRQACPLHANCQGYVQLIARGDEEAAMAVLAEVLPFPGILGRVCSRPCESVCNRREVDGAAVSIRDLKRYLADNVALPPTRAAPDRAERVAVVGAGPAGAMAALCLRKQGFTVDLYDANQRLGGMLAMAVPEFRLPTSVLNGELSLLERLGVTLQLGTRVGADVSLSEISERSDAVLLTTGAQRSRRLGIPGEDLVGIYPALEFLRLAKRQGIDTGRAQIPEAGQTDRSAGEGTAAAKDGPQVGMRVVVVGGGNTAIDAAQTAYRLGAQDVALVCLESATEMPAFAWEVADAREEGIRVLNGWGPLRLVGSEGRVREIVLRRCLRVFDAAGRWSPSFDESELRTMAVDTVVVAIGQEADLSYLDHSPISTAGGRILVDPLTLQCPDRHSGAPTLEKVFAAGDAATGPRTVIEALAAGRDAAESIGRYLRGEDLRYGRSYLGPYDLDFAADKSGAIARPRVGPRKVTGGERRSFAELTLGVSAEQARAEAERCLSCGQVYGKYRACWFCLPCEVECPERALRVEIPFLLR